MHQTPDYLKLVKLAQTPAGQRLLAILRASGGEQLKTIMECAAAGEAERAKAMLSTLLSEPETQQLLKELEGQL